MKTTSKKNIFLIPLKFRGKPFLGLAQLSKIFEYIVLIWIKSAFYEKFWIVVIASYILSSLDES